MAISYAPVVATFVDGRGDPVGGYLLFDLSSVIRDPTTGQIIDTFEVKYTLSLGHLSGVLAANEDPDAVPSDSVYDVSEVLDEDSGMDYQISVPLAGLDLSAVDVSFGANVP